MIDPQVGWMPMGDKVCFDEFKESESAEEE
jgi:hypothetical protein